MGINDGYVSRNHCRIVWDGIRDRWTVEDLGSVNGTSLGGVPLREPVGFDGPITLDLGGAVRLEVRPESPSEMATLPQTVGGDGIAAQDITPRAPAWSSLTIFADMAPQDIFELRAAMEPVQFAAGDVILRQGDLGEEMFLLERGKLEVEVEDEDGRVGFQGTLTGPAVFGEISLITKEPRSATVRALSEAACYKIGKDRFHALMREHPEVSALLTKVVGDRLLASNTIRKVGKYRITGRLGAGAMATVFEGLHPELQQPVALKMLSHALVAREDFVRRFRGEARLVASLHHEGITRVLDTEEAYGTRFIVMEKLDGILLEDLIEQGTRLSWDEIRQILRQVALALDYSHSKDLLHRDIKPGNIFLTSDHKVKILDFGIAVPAEGTGGQSTHIEGTPAYISPEQIRGERLDGRTDIYSLGIVAYQLICGDYPFHGKTLDKLLDAQLNQPLPDVRAKAPEAPQDLVDFTVRATAKRRDERFASCAEAARFLDAHLEGTMVGGMSVKMLTIAYHPSCRTQVEAAVGRLRDELQSLSGVSFVTSDERSQGNGEGPPGRK